MAKKRAVTRRAPAQENKQLPEPAEEKTEDAPIGRAPEPDPEPEDKPWKMPSVSRGQPVIFYPRGTISKRNADLGFVATVGESAIGIAYRNQGLDECYHRDDPRLVDNPEIKNEIGGIWEFTSDQIKILDRLDELERRLNKIEG